jgi:hypothetical protein
MKTRVLGAVLVILASSLTAISATASPSLRAVSLASPCAQPGPTPTYSHVVWIMLENVGYSVVGSSSAPYLNSLENRCGLATNDVAISHPSLPNYFALTAGSTIGVADDGEPSVHPLNIANIFLQLNGNWRALVESMPTPCDHVTSGSYAARHNPAVYYNNISGSCKRNDVPLSSPLNLSAAFTFISPMTCTTVPPRWATRGLRVTCPRLLRVRCISAVRWCSSSPLTRATHHQITTYRSGSSLLQYRGDVA